jgi:hypothetical protein
MVLTAPDGVTKRRRQLFESATTTVLSARAATATALLKRALAPALSEKPGEAPPARVDTAPPPPSHSTRTAVAPLTPSVKKTRSPLAPSAIPWGTTRACAAGPSVKPAAPVPAAVATVQPVK